MALQDRDWQEWAHHPVTQAFVAQLAETKQEAMEEWARQGFLRETAELTAMANARAVGGVDMLQQVIDRMQEHKVVETERNSNE